MKLGTLGSILRIQVKTHLLWSLFGGFSLLLVRVLFTYVNLWRPARAPYVLLFHRDFIK
jgi:hypothetical protein